MKKLTNKIKKAGVGLGLFTLFFMPLKAQKNDIKIKAGVTYTTAQIEEISEGCLGIETLAEKEITKRIFAELETGLYTNRGSYSKMQTNFGLKYKPITKNDWTMGIKTAIGVSNEVHTKTIQYSILETSEISSVNKIIGLDVEKTFKNEAGINFGISKNINKNVWRAGIKWIFKPYNKKYYRKF